MTLPSILLPIKKERVARNLVQEVQSAGLVVNLAPQKNKLKPLVLMNLPRERTE
jgi:hypothetical protein